MTIIFVCGGYFPNTSATGNCIRRIADLFSMRGHRVIVVCKSGEEYESTEDAFGQRIFRVTDRRLSTGIALQKAKNSSLGYKIRLFSYRVEWALYGLMRPDGMDKDLVNAYKAKMTDISKTEKIDAIVPCCMPAEALASAYQFKKDNKEVKLFTILYDQYSENVNYFRFRFNHALRRRTAFQLEKNIFGNSEKVFYVDNWKDYFAKHEFSNAVRVEHPLIIKRTPIPQELKKANRINAIYQGEVNKQMRPPTAMMKAFDYIVTKDPSVSLHICAYGSMIDEITAQADKHPENIVFYGKVNKDVADGYYDAANVAVILGNKDKRLVPSKIFECISSGYPIVYFYYTEEETSYKLLKKYPLVYFIKQGTETEKQYDLLLGWINESHEKRIPFELIRETFSDATPDHVAEAIESIIGDDGITC